MRIKNLIPWKERSEVGLRPEEPFYNLQREMNRLFNEFAHGLEFPIFGDGDVTFAPCVDVVETDTSFKVTAELPGLVEKDIELTLAPHVLTIKGEKKVEKEVEVKEENYYRQERHYGAFTRTIPLPVETIDQEKVEAIFKNGILTINLMKLPQAQQVAKHIPVKTV